MGQQQLLIIVMAVVVTMASVAMGMQAFAEGQKKANADALVDDALSVSADVQGWRLQPQPMGGGRGASLDDFNLTSLGYSTNGGEYDTRNGTFTAYESGGTIIVVGDNTDYENRVMVTINGQGSYCLATKITDTADEDPMPASDHPTCSGI